MTIDLSCATRWITLGFERENLARQQEFDFSAWAEEYGDGVPQLLFQRPGETTPYPVLLTVEGTTATWTPTATDTAIAGEGKAQLSYVVDEVVAKNAIFAVLINPSLGASGDPPEGFETWLEELTEMAADAQAAAISAGNAETAAETAQGLAEAARDAAADYAGDAQDAAGDAQAAQRNAEAAESAAEAAEGRAAGYANDAAGSAGTAGDAATAATNAKTAAQTAQGLAEDAQAAAVSAKDDAVAAKTAIEDMTATASVADDVPGTPSVTVTKSTVSGHENLDFVFSHVKGAKGDTGSQGVQGPTGPQGPRGYDGSDGYSPTVTVTDISGGHNVTITDKNGPHSFDVLDGSVGNIDAGDVVYDDQEEYPLDTVGAEISSVKSALNSKIDSPSTPGTNGQVLTSDGQGGQSWQTPQGGGGDVASVNGQTGTVVLDAGDLEYGGTETYPSDSVGEAISDLSSEVNAKPNIDLGILGASAGTYAKVKTVDTSGRPTSWEYGTPSGGGGGGAVDSVNGHTGEVVLDAGDIGYSGATAYAATSVGNVVSKNLLSTEIVFKPHWFIAGKGIASNGTYSDVARATASVFNIFAFTGAFRIVSSDSNIEFSVYDYVNASFVSGWSQDYTSFSGMKFAITVRTKDNTTMTATKVAKVSVFTSAYEAEKFAEANRVVLTESDNFRVGVNGFIHRAIVISGDTIGLLTKTETSKYAVSPKELYCEKAVTILVGRYNSNSAYITVNGETTVVPQGKFLTVPAKTPFLASLICSQDSSSVFPQAIWYVIHDGPRNASMAVAQMFASVSATTDTAVMIGDKTYAIAKAGTYKVIQDETILATGDVSHSLGHANSANYDNGYIYVSDWTDPTIIHVLSVSGNTLAYSKQITVPNTGVGSTEYHVFDGEKQIFGLGWESGNSGTTPNVLFLTLWVKYGDTYIEAWKKKVVRPETMQSFTIYNGCAFYAEIYSANSKTKGIGKINLSTGESTSYTLVSDSSLMNKEIESIVPVSQNVFLCETYDGIIYMVSIGNND